MTTITYTFNPRLSNDTLNALFACSWPGHTWRDFQSILARSLTYVCACDASQLIGYINLAWDGGVHGFITSTMAWLQAN
jgi:hypothetical protein